MREAGPPNTRGCPWPRRTRFPRTRMASSAGRIRHHRRLARGLWRLGGRGQPSNPSLGQRQRVGLARRWSAIRCCCWTSPAAHAGKGIVPPFAPPWADWPRIVGLLSTDHDTQGRRHSRSLCWRLAAIIQHGPPHRAKLCWISTTAPLLKQNPFRSWWRARCHERRTNPSPGRAGPASSRCPACAVPGQQIMLLVSGFRWHGHGMPSWTRSPA